MKIYILILVVITLSVGYSSCSRCYECSIENEIIDNNGNVTTTTAVEKVCTASSNEIENKEAVGYTCVPE